MSCVLNIRILLYYTLYNNDNRYKYIYNMYLPRA